MSKNYFINTSQREIDRKKVWASVRKLKTFTKRELMFDSETNKDTSREYVNALFKGGYVEKTGEKIKGSIQFRLCKDVGIDAPRIRRDGSKVEVPVYQKVWNAMRIYKRFTYEDLLIAVPDTTKESLKSYLKYLQRAGYIKKLSRKQFFLITSRYTGKQAPSIRSIKQVYDPNIEKVVWPVEENL